MPISSGTAEELRKRSSSEYFVYLLEISGPGIDGTVRFCDKKLSRLSETSSTITWGCVSSGLNYLWFPFRLNIPETDFDGGGSAELVIGDSKKLFLPQILNSGFTSDRTVRIMMALASNPSSVQQDLSNLKWGDTRIKDSVIFLTLKTKPFALEPIPALGFFPKQHRGLF